MELRQLKYFATIVEQGSFSRAAREIYVAQPALSNQIAALESELKTQLLLRGARGVQPTAAGLALYRTASSVLRQVESVRRDVTACKKHPSGSVSIGIPSSTAVGLALPLLREVRAHYPEIRIQITESLATLVKELLVHGRVDMAILLNEKPSKSFRHVPLLSEALYLASPISSCGPQEPSRQIRLADLASVPLFLPSRLVPMRQQIDATTSSLGVELNVIAEIDSVQTLKASVEAGLGSTILPWSALHKEVSRNAIVVQKIVNPTICWTTSVCMADDSKATPAIRAVFDLVPSVIASLTREHGWQGIEVLHAPRLQPR